MLLLLATLLLTAQDDGPVAPPVDEARSVFLRPLYLTDAPPEVRSARLIHVAFDGAPGVTPPPGRSREEARVLADELHRRLTAGTADFEELAYRYSAARNARTGGVLGTFARGMLSRAYDDFMFGASPGDLSAPIELPTGYHILQRIDSRAACRQLMVRGRGEESRRRCLELLERARAGEDFQDLAREHSDDPESAPRGGDLAVFERGPSDRILKAAAFRAKVGEVVGPIESPLGWHLVQRVPLDALAPELWEENWIRVRSILVACNNAPVGMPFHERTPGQARAIAADLRAKLLAGADMAELAAQHDDDETGRTRGGNLGWVHRKHPVRAPVLDRLFLAPTQVGMPTEPVPIQGGWMVLLREI